MTLWTKRCLAAGMAVGAAWTFSPGVASAGTLSHRPLAYPSISAATIAASTACDNGGMIGSGTVICTPPTAG